MCVATRLPKAVRKKALLSYPDDHPLSGARRALQRLLRTTVIIQLAFGETKHSGATRFVAAAVTLPDQVLCGPRPNAHVSILATVRRLEVSSIHHQSFGRVRLGRQDVAAMPEHPKAAPPVGSVVAPRRRAIATRGLRPYWDTSSRKRSS